MTLSSNIFQKPCPACATSVSVSAARCDCGHVFESSASSQSPLEATLRDEELYEGYLAARAEQAQQAAHAADAALADDKSNSELISASALAWEVAKSIESDLAEQRNKIAAMRNALRTANPAAAAPPAAIAPAVQTPAVQTTATKHTVAAKSTASPVARKSAPPKPAEPAVPAPTARISTSSAGLKKTSPATPSAKPASESVWRATTTQKAAGVLSALKNAKAREAVARAQQAVAAAEAEQASALPVASTHGTAAPSAFRKEQASRAEKIMEARKTTDGKECPNCTSSVPVNTTRCQCGFAFVSGGTELPSLTLCTGDFTALRNSFKLNLRS